MTVDAAGALKLKDKGNVCFMKKEYRAAESYYSQAIILNNQSSVLYSNRAMARLKMGCYEEVINDCRRSIDLDPEAVKPYYYLSQAMYELFDYEGALENAIAAQHRCIDRKEYKSLPMVNEIIRNSRQARWKVREEKRLREFKEFEMEMVRLIEEERDQQLAEVSGEAFEEDIKEGARRRLAVLLEVLERARKVDDRKRVVPEWAIDDITYEIMTDPVMTKSGTSYERSSIVEHLKHQQLDPVSREPMTIEELRPNIALRKACEDFLDANGWAADW